MNIYYLDVILYKYDLILARFYTLKQLDILKLLTYENNKHDELIFKYTNAIEDLNSEHELLEDGDKVSKRIFRNVQRSLKKTKRFKNKFMRYKRFFRFLLRKLKYRKLKKRTLKNFCRKHH